MLPVREANGDTATERHPVTMDDDPILARIAVPGEDQAAYQVHRSLPVDHAGTSGPVEVLRQAFFAGVEWGRTSDPARNPAGDPVAGPSEGFVEEVTLDVAEGSSKVGEVGPDGFGTPASLGHGGKQGPEDDPDGDGAAYLAYADGIRTMRELPEEVPALKYAFFAGIGHGRSRRR